MPDLIKQLKTAIDYAESSGRGTVLMTVSDAKELYRRVRGQ
jgi:hypothetical protein